MTKRLSTRLTVLFAGLFAAVLLAVSIAVVVAITGAATRQVRAELAATGTVFDRVWSLRSDRLQEGASLLSRDFGFREAVATRDQPTIVSAMENLRRRMGIDYAFMVGADGKVAGASFSAADTRELIGAFDAADDPSGVFMLGGEPHQLVSAPVFSPELIGWVVFAVRLDRREMSALEHLSAVPLTAVVLHKDRGGQWTNHQAKVLDDPRVRRFIDQSLRMKAAEPGILDVRGRSVVLVKPLPSLDVQSGAVLLLRYPLSQALAPYRPMLLIVGLIGLAGLAVVGWGSWLLARGVTRPISALDAAANRLQRGEDAQVAIETDDEIGRLADSFNTMATEIRDRERKITHLALHDGDTGLPNRLALERVVEGLAAEPQGRVYVAALGIDRFNHVRGAIGYKLAAQAVRMIGNRLAGLSSAGGVARIASDVLGFALLAEHPEGAADDAQRLLAKLEEPIRIGGETIDVALSVGLAPVDGDPAQAIEKASIALDQARAAKRKVGFFDAEAYGDPASNLSLMSSLLRGLEAGEVELYHQPKFDVRKRQSCGTEALVRWRHPTRGLLSPDLFIPMAEETGHIRALTEWVVRQAIADQKALAAAGHKLDVALNISGRTLSEPDFADFVEAELKGAVGTLCFEITETAVIENPEVAMAMLDRFADLGVLVAIDDFGAGLSSLAYLKRIRAHELKIDKSIVEGVTGAQRDALIVRSTIDLAHSLGLKVTAEGVETSDCFSLLAAMGCDQAQGYLFARPQPLSELFDFLEQDQRSLKAYG